MAEPRTAVVAGVGPGLGAALARRFAAEGCRVGLFARSTDVTGPLAEELAAGPGDGLAVEVDVSDREAVEQGFERVREAFGSVDVLVHNASAAPWTGLLDADPEAFDRALGVGPRGALYCAQAAVPDMLDGDGGTVLFTGATTSVRGREGAVGFSAAKFALRGMAESMARELGPQGVHVAHVVLDGQILPPDGPGDRDESEFLDPGDVAETYWRLVEQDVDTMEFEVHVTNGTRSIEFL